MSSPTDQKLLSLLHEITTQSDLDLSTADKNNEIDDVIAEENAYSKKRSQEFLLTEMEQKLEIAEINFGTLKQQLDYMKMLYNDIHKESDKLDKHRKDHQKKRSQSKVKNICKTLPLKRRFSSASVHKAKQTLREKVKPFNRKTVTYVTSASNTEEPYIVSQPQSARKKNKSPRKFESEQKISPKVTLSEMPLKETEKNQLEKSNAEPVPASSRKEQNKNLLQMACNQEQQIEPLEVHSAHEIEQDFWYGYAEDANQMVEHCVHISENLVETHVKSKDQEESFSCEPTEEEIEYTVLISGNSRTSTNNSCRTSGKREVYPKHMFLENPKKGNKKHKGKQKRSMSQSTILTINPIFEDSNSVNKPKRKSKALGGNTEKKRKSASKTSILTRRFKPKITETVISVTTKTSTKKPSKMKLPSTKNTLGNKKEKRVHSHHKLTEEQPAVEEAPVPSKPNNNLVELYHNENVNMNISEENVPESGTNAPKPILNTKNQGNVPPQSSKKKLSARRTGKKETTDVKSNQNEPAEPKEMKPPVTVLPTLPAPFEEEKGALNTLEETKTADLTEPYTQPQGPTRFKYFKRNYYKRLNFKKIPFVAGTSTSPSHNLGLNIQQVLSMIKMKQPQFKENITSHTQVVESSTFLEHTVHRRTRSICPAKVHRRLTEEPEKEVSKEAQGDNSSTTTSNTANGLLFGLRNKIKRPEDIWVVDQDSPSKRLRCTCVPSRRCTDYQQLLIEYVEKGGGDISFLNRKYSEENYPEFPASERRFRSHFSAVDKAVPGIMSSAWNMQQNMITTNTNNNDKLASIDLPENGHNVKGVLSRLHTDFNRLNMKIKQLQNGSTKDLFNEEKQLEIRKLEKALRAKENEINMIMDLYKEVSMDSWEV